MLKFSESCRDYQLLSTLFQLVPIAVIECSYFSSESQAVQKDNGYRRLHHADQCDVSESKALRLSRLTGGRTSFDGSTVYSNHSRKVPLDKGLVGYNAWLLCDHVPRWNM